MQSGKTSTVWDECQRRGGCRRELKEVEVAVLGIDDVFKVYASHWNSGQQLRLNLLRTVATAGGRDNSELEKVPEFEKVPGTVLDAQARL